MILYQIKKYLFSLFESVKLVSETIESSRILSHISYRVISAHTKQLNHTHTHRSTRHTITQQRVIHS